MDQSRRVGGRGLGEAGGFGESLGANCHAERVAAEIPRLPTVAPHGMDQPATGERRSRNAVEGFAPEAQDGVGDVVATLGAAEVGGIRSAENAGREPGVEADEHFEVAKVGGTALGELEKLRQNRWRAGDRPRHLNNCLEVGSGFHQRINSGLEGTFTITLPVWLARRMVRLTRPLISHATTSSSRSWLSL